ncbi:MAG TPA: asparaginase [Planctomycetaceae bacterium]|nr:asparaginase [Planctomycetaceae bacterium]
MSPTFVQIFSCGGTIDKIYFDSKSDYEVGEPQIDEIFKRCGVAFEFEIVSLMRKDSLEMSAEDRTVIQSAVESCPASHVLITHGTDTMTETGRALLQVPNKTIVLTGSMTPARFQASDAEFNIGVAVGALMNSAPGVYVAMNGLVFPTDRVQKNRDAGRFESTKD